MKKHLFAIALSTLMGGCAYQPPAYQADKSEAYNIAHAGGLTQLRDYGTVDKTTGAILDAGFIGTGFINPQFGMTSLEGGAALFVGSLLSNKPLSHAERSSLMAWMPKHLASNKDDAKHKMVSIVENAIVNTLTTDYGLSTENGSLKVDKYQDGSVVAVTVTKAEWDCDRENVDKQCIIRAHIRTPSLLPSPEFIGKGEVRYAFLSDHDFDYNSFYAIIHKDNTVFPSDEIYSKVSSSMPAWAFQFISPMENIYHMKGNKNIMELRMKNRGEKHPYILKKGERKYFAKSI